MEHNHKVLIVDDEVQVGKLIDRFLKIISVNSVYASNAMEALYKIENMTQPFSLIICDQRMPEMSGTELLEKVSHISPNTVRFLITGYTDIKTIINAINKGKIHKYIPKPLNSEQLIEDIKAGLKQYELNLENEKLFQMAKKQNTKLYALNLDLKRNAAKQTKIIATIEKERQAANEIIDMPEQSFVNNISSVSQAAKELLKTRGITDEQKLNPLLEALVAELYGRFQDIAFKKGFELDLGIDLAQV